MKVLWITNLPLLAQRKKGIIVTSGSWLDATLDELKRYSDMEIIIATTGDNRKLIESTIENVHYLILPGGRPNRYNHNRLSNRTAWKYVMNKYQPDLIHIWGTEYKHGYLALKVLQGIPSVIYMQGMMRAIARYMPSGLTKRELRTSYTFKDIVLGNWMSRLQSKLFAQADIESRMLSISKNVIVENKWCEAYCRASSPVIRTHMLNLAIKSEFYEKQWSVDTMEPYSIMCNAPVSYIKGFHILLLAIKLLIKEFPKILLYVPGYNNPFEQNLKEKILSGGYSNLIKKKIVELELQKNIIFMGSISAELMADRMSKSNVFVLPSSIENHSSSLIEAMIVGTPSIATFVGGIPEYLFNNENGLLYRFEEYEVLAMHLKSLFGNTVLAETISNNARESTRKNRQSANLANELVSIYKKVMDNSNL